MRPLETASRGTATMTASIPPGPADTTAAERRKVADPILAEVAQLLAEVPEEQLFGDTAFAVRDRILRLVAAAYTPAWRGKKARAGPPAPSPGRARSRPPRRRGEARGC